MQLTVARTVSGRWRRRRCHRNPRRRESVLLVEVAAAVVTVERKCIGHLQRGMPPRRPPNVSGDTPTGQKVGNVMRMKVRNSHDGEEEWREIPAGWCRQSVCILNLPVLHGTSKSTGHVDDGHGARVWLARSRLVTFPTKTPNDRFFVKNQRAPAAGFCKVQYSSGGQPGSLLGTSGLRRSLFLARRHDLSAPGRTESAGHRPSSRGNARV